MDAYYLATDTETGGIGPEVSLLTAYLAVLNEKFEIIDELSLAIKPDDGIYHVTGEALGINRIDLTKHDKDEATVTAGAAGGKLREFLVRNSNNGALKLVPLGHNVAFDMEKIYANVLNKREAQKYVSYRTLDTGSTGQFLKAVRIIPETVSGSLESYVRHFSVAQKEAHTARGDVEMTVDVMKAMIDAVSRYL